MISVPNIKYDRGSMYRCYEEMARYQKEHPNGPYTYSDWSGIPDNEEYREKWFTYLKLYCPMVEENNVCHMNVTESTLTEGKLPEGVYMSLFTGCEQYLCLSNLSECEQTVDLCDPWMDRESGAVVASVTLKPAELAFLKRI